ncbi:hypothetical protein PF003_g267 [Phytophthora fragariae]|nr:hypothetical protein PF003_g267 [Phytophthora fragariae]
MKAIRAAGRASGHVCSRFRTVHVEAEPPKHIDPAKTRKHGSRPSALRGINPRMFAEKPLGHGCAPLGPGSRETWHCWPAGTAGSLAEAAEADAGGGMAQRASAQDTDKNEMRCTAAQKSHHHDGESLV